MAKRILITDSLFVYAEHVALLKAAGFVVERLDKPQASADELSLALRDKQGYILGGVERVTDQVIEAATKLEAISFTGSGYTEFIPGYERATRRGIAISAAVGGNAVDVAEFTIGLLFEMVRNLPLLQAPREAGGAGFYIARRVRGLRFGVVGYGHIGTEVARLACALGMDVVVTSRHAHEMPPGINQVSLDELLDRSDVVTVHVDKSHGTGVLGAREISRMNPGTIVINTAFPEAVDSQALGRRVMAGELRAAFDAASDWGSRAVVPGSYVSSNAQTGFNTIEANRTISDRVTSSIINLLTSGSDPDLVNPDYRSYRNVPPSKELPAHEP